MSFHSPKNKAGFTVVEVLISTAIFVIIGLGIANFGQNIFSINTSLQNNLSAQLDGRLVLKKIVAELRSASPSSLGGYPVESAGTSSLVFYSNVDSDVYKERIRYYLVGTVLYREVTYSENIVSHYSLKQYLHLWLCNTSHLFHQVL